MQYTGKPFQRRPWDEFSNKLIQHFDGINVTGITKQPAFYFCFHTAAAWLNKNEIKCTDPEGWSWPAIVLENFGVDSLIAATGALFTDGIVPGTKFDLTIRKGIFKNLDKDSCLINLKSINFGHLAIESLTMANVQTPSIILEDCTADMVTIKSTQAINFDTSKSPGIKKIEKFGCKDCKFSGDVQVTDFELPRVIDGTILGSMAISIALNGEIFTTEAANLRFNVKAPK